MRVKKYQKLMRTSRTNKWRDFCTNTESVRENARMNKIIKNLGSHKEKLEAVTREDGSTTNSPMETLQTMAKVHFKEEPDPGPPKDGTAHTNQQPKPEPADLLQKMFNPDRLTEVVKSFGPFKAAGPDGIQPITIQKAWPVIGPTVRRLLQACHKNKYTPIIWREAKAIYLPKPGKTDYNSPKSFRTITLTPILQKIHEKCVKWYIDFDLNMSELSSDRQFGFKKGSSTETALHKVVRCIEKRIAKKGFVMGTFLDIEGAFDNISFEAITRAIKKSPIDDTTAGWITNMVSNRYVNIELKDNTIRIKIKRGCPQGGILSPFLWNLVVDDLLRLSVKDVPGYLQAFADDLITLVKGNDLDVIRARTQKTINTIENWCKDNGLNISALKTKIIMFTSNKKWKPPKPITVGGIETELSNSVKFLGVTLDNKLNFNQHITNITKKATASLMQCKRAVGPTWGLTPKTCLWIYKATIRPILSYSSVILIWINAIKKAMNTQKLKKVQRLALGLASGAMPGTANISLDKLTDTPSIVNYLKGEAAKGAARLKAYGDWSCENNKNTKGSIHFHTTTNNNFLNTLNLPNLEFDLIKTRLTLHRKYQTEINDRSLHDQIISELDKESITCYTDGSKTEEGTGYGSTTTTNNNNIELNTQSSKLPDYCTVYQAELTAITNAATALNTIANNKTIVFFTDSQSSIEALAKITMNSKTTLECHNALNTLSDTNTVHVNFKWIAGHEGHWGNEKADELAKKGTTSTNLTKGYLPQSLIKSKINQKVTELDKQEWSEKGPSHCKKALNNKQTHIKNLRSIQQNRNDYRTAMHLLSGHVGLNSHLFKMRLTETKICVACGEEDETVGHFLGKCPALYNIRLEIFHTHIIQPEEVFNHPLRKLIRFANKTKRLRFDPTKRDSVT